MPKPEVTVPTSWTEWRCSCGQCNWEPEIYDGEYRDCNTCGKTYLIQEN